MNPKVRLLLYVVLVVVMASCAAGFYAAFHSKEAPPVPPSGTNVTGSASAGVTNAPAVDDEGEMTARRKSTKFGRMTAYGVTMFFCLIGLGVMVGFDVSKYFANRVNDFIFNDDLKGMKDPEYEEAEHVYSAGDHLEAVRLMRQYLNRHPREQYVALRIAEIYENDLKNYLAAALEYEEILKKKLPDERWGWAAIHLANLYSGKLNKSEEAAALLRRIADQYGHTAAAKKARERLGLPETPAAGPIRVVLPQAAPEPPPSDEPPSNLPKGFRPK